MIACLGPGHQQLFFQGFCQTHHPAITFLTKLFNAVLRWQYIPPAWKHARMVSILKPGKDPTLPSSYRPISLLDTVGKVFEKILLARVVREVKERGLLRDEQFGFRPRYSTALQLGRLVERLNRNLDERRLTGLVFLDVAKAFDTVWVKGLLYKLTILNFPSYQEKTLSSYLHSRTFQSSFNSATSTRRNIRAGHARALPPRRVSAVRGWHGSHSYVPQSIPSRQLPGDLSQ
jgi:hypothetical protein